LNLGVIAEETKETVKILSVKGKKRRETRGGGDTGLCNEGRFVRQIQDCFSGSVLSLPLVTIICFPSATRLPEDGIGGKRGGKGNLTFGLRACRGGDIIGHFTRAAQVSGGKGREWKKESRKEG